MSGRDFADDLHRGAGSVGAEIIARILATLHRRTVPDLKNAAIKRYVIYAPYIDKHDTSLIFTNVADFTKSPEDQGRGLGAYWRRIPPNPLLYELVHTTTGTLVFPADTTKYGAEGKFGGTQYILIDHHTRLNFSKTSPFTIAFWFKVANAGTSMIFVSKSNDIGLSTNAGWAVYRSSTNLLWFRLLDGSAFYDVNSGATTFIDNIWHSCVVTYSGNGNRNGMKLYIDGVLNSTGTAAVITGDITNAVKAGIGAQADAGRILTGSMSWATILSKEVNATWVTDFHSNQLMDYTGTNVEVTSIPFAGNEAPQPVATLGLFRFT